MIKAYKTLVDDSGMGSLLIFAESANSARYAALRNGTWEYDDYWSINVRRAKAYDGAYTVKTVIDTNEDLPAGYPPFYIDDWDSEE